MIITKLGAKLKNKFEKEMNKQLDKHIKELLQENPEYNCSRNSYQTMQVQTLIGTLEMVFPRLRYHTFAHKLLEDETYERIFRKTMC